MEAPPHVATSRQGRLGKPGDPLVPLNHLFITARATGTVFLGNSILVKTPKMHLIFCMTNTLQTGLGPTLVLIRETVFP